MAANNGLSSNKMASRIYKREDNQYKQSMIKEILDMYANEIYKAILHGERVQISKVGTIIPEVKTHMGNYNLPVCNANGGNLPYTKMRISRNNTLKEKMNKTLLENVEKGILGLEKLPFDVQQIRILKKSGVIPDDVAEGREE